MASFRVLGALLALLVVLPTSQAQLPPEFTDVFERAFPDVSFTRPVALRADPAGSGWLFVAEQAGVIKAFEGHLSRGAVHTVLDLQERVVGQDVHIESGLLGLALHPGFATNGYIYVYYVTDEPGAWSARLSRFTTSGAPAIADPESELILLELPRSDLAHNGGDVHFGPDGHLYVSIGDGACCADPFDNGQDRTNLFGTIIRIDVDDPQGDQPYGIPADNPFAGNTEGWREEIWAYGLRNPWRFSFHPQTGEIWMGDVGELEYEEINRIVPGGNYGWNVMEGPDCFEWPPGSGAECDPTGLILPVWYYGRDEGVSVTGGYAYRGERAPDMLGKYLFADWGLGKFFVATLDADAEEVLEVETLFSVPGFHPSAFGEDHLGEFYMLEYFSGFIYRFVEGVFAAPDPPGIVQARLLLDGPNPVRERTTLRIDLPTAAEGQIDLVDMLGRRIPLMPPGLIAAGETSVTVDASSLPAGLYVARLMLDGVAAGAVKLVVVR